VISFYEKGDDMAKRLVLTGIIVLLVLSLTAPAYCDDALKKLGRGVCNVATSPYELIYQTMKSNNSDGAFAAVTVGVLKGVGMIAVRALVGVYEIASFPIPFPRGYQPILKDPEFFFEDQNW